MPKHQLKTYTIYCGDNLKMLNDKANNNVEVTTFKTFLRKYNYQ